MFLCPSELVLRIRSRCMLVALVLTIASGCATSGPGDTGNKSAESTSVSEKDRARLKVDGNAGFTVTEVVRIDSDVRADYREANVLLRQERFDEGIALLEDIVVRAPELTAPHIDLGIAYGLAGDQESAERSLLDALALAPNHPVALNELGIVYRRTGRFDLARTSYRRALEVHPGYHYALRNLGVLCDLYLEDLECALKQYQTYAELVSGDKQVDIWIADIRNRIDATR